MLINAAKCIAGDCDTYKLETPENNNRNQNGSHRKQEYNFFVSHSEQFVVAQIFAVYTCQLSRLLSVAIFTSKRLLIYGAYIFKRPDSEEYFSYNLFAVYETDY